MSKYVEKSATLRSIVSPHYNCAQSVVMPFAQGAGVDEAIAMLFASAFGGGMKRGSVCGAITGGLMALGLYGIDDAETLNVYYNKLKTVHNGCLDCSMLLKMNEDVGGEKKPFCDGMVFECVELVEGILKGKDRL